MKNCKITRVLWIQETKLSPFQLDISVMRVWIFIEKIFYSFNPM